MMLSTFAIANPMSSSVTMRGALCSLAILW